MRLIHSKRLPASMTVELGATLPVIRVMRALASQGLTLRNTGIPNRVEIVDAQETMKCRRPSK